MSVSSVVTVVKLSRKNHTADYKTYLNNSKERFVRVIRYLRVVKVRLVYELGMSHCGDDPLDKTLESETEVTFGSVGKAYDEMIGRMIEKIETLTDNGSGWSFAYSTSLTLHVTKFKPFSGGAFVKLPKELEAKKALINMKSADDYCFKWCVTRHFNPVESHADRVSKVLKEQSEKFDWSGLEFPVKIDAIGKFEKNNQIAVNVYGYGREIYPLRVSKVKAQVVNLLYYENHYVLVKDFHRLVSNQITNGQYRTHFCHRCLVGFPGELALESHSVKCGRNFAAVLPEVGSVIHFKDYNRQMQVPFVVYADFECFIKNDVHTPSSYCYYMKSFDEKVLRSEFKAVIIEERENDVAQHFVDSIIERAEEIVRLYKKNKKMILTPADLKDFDNADKCCICKHELGDDRVKDHCHLTGKYRGAAHNECNLNHKMPKFLPVFFHNLCGYDAHLFVTKFKTGNGRTLKCIPHTEEKFISFSYVFPIGNKENFEIRFLDSYKFMSSSLDVLAKTVSDFSNLERYFDNADLLKKKGIYPYEWASLERLNDKQLPPIECFYSKLRGEGISEAEYEHAKKVWEAFDCVTFRDYHGTYNVCDVLILADVFESFRKVCMTNYGLDPAWYYTSPGLSWSAMLKMTGVKLELLSDIDMIDMVSRGIRGGVSMISNRFSHANNKYMKDYDPELESKYLMYLDANNLYGWAMCQKMPYADFKWMNESELSDWESIPCILMVDLEYPKELHDKHSDYPLAPEPICVDKVEKLIPNLHDKNEYVVHHVALKQYLSLGLKLKRVVRGIRFSEGDWLSEYIMGNTELRAKAKSDFEKDFYKLMNNSVFGKTMENIENRVDIRLVADKDSMMRLTSKDTYTKHTMMGNLVAVHMKRTKLTYDKPIYVGMSILDISKTLMYGFHYDHMMKKYGKDKLKLMFTDTDSLLYEIKTEDVYEDMLPDLDLYDTSDYPTDHKLHSNENKKVIGKMKDESCGKIITEFVGLRAKLYSYQINGIDFKKCKGVVKSVTRKGLTHEDYHECLMTKIPKEVKMTILKSEGHVIRTTEINKVALSANDDKRVILDDGTTTLAVGHYKT